MEAIRRHVQIPSNRILQVEVPLPESIQPGPAEMIVVISPEAPLSERKGFLSHAGALADSALFTRGGMTIQEEILKEGGQNYDVMGWNQEQLINDILDQYEKHLHFLHLVR